MKNNNLKVSKLSEDFDFDDYLSKDFIRGNSFH